MKWTKNREANKRTHCLWLELQRPRSPNPEKLNANNINYSWWFSINTFHSCSRLLRTLLPVHHTVALVDFHRNVARSEIARNQSLKFSINTIFNWIYGDCSCMLGERKRKLDMISMAYWLHVLVISLLHQIIAALQKTVAK